MQIFLLTLGLLLIVFVAMSIGYILQKKTLAGSCGGLGSLGIDKACNCDNPCDRRKERLEKEERWKQDQIL
ncbi:(Na+)-NQR maturation NqrM [Psychrosphaera haliotis]|uniref:(Na+)-NQR maturation NqrM n=1 Tax=Psychrosphaera haliotis TaxID=555083 RepID=A0A6N8F935_9GAMM|nr:(Na+)-NQR maturation NqrM [Psychrosphaera haliotis]MDB2373482.1 (Na+)-NQR maturation NqrM [Psychrosphaera haliotis]MUH73046.1 (Na+)-NQR maturation NqrM [Psychrosphaera haliotis]